MLPLANAPFELREDELFIITPSDKVSNTTEPEVFDPLAGEVAEEYEPYEPDTTLATNKVSPPLLK
jgi:hypothetical protein